MKKITILFGILLLFTSTSYAQLFSITECLATVDSNANGPMYSSATANSTNRTAALYPSSQLTGIAGQTLNTLYYKRLTATGSMAGTPNFKVYMKEVTGADFGAAALDWATAITGATLVYDSNPAASVGSTAGFKSFPMSTNFLYSGTQNLAVFTEYTNATASANIGWAYEFTAPCITTTNNNTGKYTNNTTGVLPATLTTSNYRRAIIGFDFVVSCNAPNTLVSSNITTSSADISWTENATQPQNGYEYYVSTTNTAPLTATTPTGTTSVGVTTANLGSLSSGTKHFVWVRGNCGAADKSIWSGPIEFNTLCTNVTNFVQDFEATTGALFPACWSKVGTLGSANTQASTGVSGARNLYMYSSAAASRPVVAMVPVSNAAAGTHRMTMKVRANFTAGETIELGYLTNPADATSFVSINSIVTNSTTVPQNFTTTPTGMPTGDVVFALRTGTLMYSVLIDDVTWEAIPSSAPLCASNIVATPNTSCGNQATAISWNAAAGADGYKLTIGTTMGGTEVLNNVNIGASTSYNFVGNPGTTYYYTIVPFNGVGSPTGCTENTFSTFATGCSCVPIYTTGTSDGDLISNVVITGTTLANNSGTATTGPSYTYYTGQPNYTATLQAGSSYSVQVTVGSFSNQNVAVWIDYNDNLTFEPSEKVGFTTASVAGSGTASFNITLSCSPPLGLHKMRVRDVYATTGSSIDPCLSYGYGETEDYDVTISAAVACPQPSNLAATTITSTTASLTWNIGCAETMWDLHLTTAGGAAPTGTPSNPNVSSPFPATMLTASTAYDFYVRADCAANGASLWTGPFTFTTLATPPVNDDCLGSIALTVGHVFADNEVIATNIGATNSNPPAPGCGSFLGGDVWYSVVVPASGSITVETNSNTGSTMTDTGMAVYSGACGTLVLIECDDDDSADGAFSKVVLTGQTPGATLYVNAWEYGNNLFDTFKVSAYDCSSTTLAPTGNATTTLCSGSTVAELVATGTAIKWYTVATGGTALVSTTALVDGTTYYASQTIDCESFDRLAVTVTLTPVTPAPTGNASQTFCNGATVTNLTAIGTTVQWYDAASAGNLLLNSTPLVDGTIYYASQILNSCESSTRLAVTATVTTTALPTGDATQTFCVQGNITQLVVVGTSIKWYDAAIGGNLLPNIPAIGLVNNATYYASQTANSCESERLAVLVVINPAVTPTFNPISDLCQGVTAPILATTSLNGVQGTWSPSTIDTSVVGMVTYNFTPNAGECVTSASVTLSVTVTASTATPTGNAMQTIPVSDVSNAVIENLVVSPTSVVWYPTQQDADAGTNAIAQGTVITDGSTYYAVDMSGSCPSASLAVTATVVLSTNSFDNASFSAYPNPVKDVLNLSYSSEISSVKVINLLGQEVISRKVNNTTSQIDMTSLTAGAYIVNVTVGDTVKTIKVIKQ